MGMALIAGLTAAAACAPLYPNEPGTGTGSSALNGTPTVATGSAQPTGRNFAATCALWDTGVNREVAITAFGYNTNTPAYLNTYDVYDDGAAGKWVHSGIVQDSGPTHTATGAAYVASVTDPELNDGNSAHLTTCYFAGGADASSVYAQVWKATVSNGTPTWTKLTDMNTARAKFGLSWGGSTTKKLIAVGGGFGTTRTNTIEVYNRTTNAWAVATTSGGVTRTLDQAVHSFGFVKLSDTQFVTAGGNGGVNNPSAHINAIKVDANGDVVSVGDIKNGASTVITAREDNIVVPTGKTGLASGRVQILVAMGQDNASPPNLVAAPRTVDINWTPTTATYDADAAGSAPLDNAAFPTFVDAYLSPKNAASNPGYLIITGLNGGASPQTPVNSIQKWTPSAGGGAWTPITVGTRVTLTQSRLGINGVYIKSIDKALVAGGTNRYAAGGASPVGTDYLNTDLIQ